MAPLYPLYDAELMRPPQEFDSLTGLVPGRSAQAFNPELLCTWRGYLILSCERQPAAGSISQWKWEHGCVYIPEASRAGPHTVPFSGQGIRRLHLQQENKIQSHKVNLEPEPAAHYIITASLTMHTGPEQLFLIQREMLRCTTRAVLAARVLSSYACFSSKVSSCRP